MKYSVTVDLPTKLEQLFKNPDPKFKIAVQNRIVKNLMYKAMGESSRLVHAAIGNRPRWDLPECAKYPGMFTGRLQGTIKDSVNNAITEDGMKVTGFIGSNLDYAAKQEYGLGTWKGKRIIPKRYMRRGYEKLLPKVEAILKGTARNICKDVGL